MSDARDIWAEYRQMVLDRLDFKALYSGLQKQRPSGDGWVTALCPLHKETEPSFGFNLRTGAWCCFAGCGKGSAIDYVMNTSGRGFKETLTQLGDSLGKLSGPYLRIVALFVTADCLEILITGLN